MIKTPLSTVIGGAFWTPGATVIGGNTPTFDQQIQKLFANGEQGFYQDPYDLSTLYQDAAETILVTAAGQPVGLILDKSKPITNISILDSTFLLADGWVKSDPEISVTNADGSLRVSKGALISKAVNKPFSCESGKLYRLTVKYKNHTGNNVRFHIRNAGGGGAGAALSQSLNTFATTDGEVSSFFISYADTHSVVIDSQNAAESSVDVESVSVVKVSDSTNHAHQTTSSMRPLLKQRPSELVINGDFGNGITGWTQGGTATVTVSGGILTVQANGATSGVYQDFTVKPNTKYRLSLTVSASGKVIVYGNWAFSPLIGVATAGALEFTPTSNKVRVYLYCTSTDVGTFDNVSLRKVVEDSYISNAISFDTIDDKLITTLPSQLTGCTVIRSVPNVGTQILTDQTIPATYEDNTDHCGLIVINRALTPSETSAIAAEFDKRAGV